MKARVLSSSPCRAGSCAILFQTSDDGAEKNAALASGEGRALSYSWRFAAKLFRSL